MNQLLIVANLTNAQNLYLGPSTVTSANGAYAYFMASFAPVVVAADTSKFLYLL